MKKAQETPEESSERSQKCYPRAIPPNFEIRRELSAQESREPRERRAQEIHLGNNVEG